MIEKIATYTRRSKPFWLILMYIWSSILFPPSMPEILAMPRPWTDLTELSLEELMLLEISTLSRRPRRWIETPAAVFVISGEDIRRSGVTSIPEALRMVPGMQVARATADRWAISSRGFNGSYSDKLQVLVDGRSVYNSVYSGVYWDNLDVLMEDLDRIEVIRGPGASLWGANAVNGVINIVTRTAAQSRGVLATATVGSEEKFIGGLRYGGRLSESAQYSAYVKHSRRDGAKLSVEDGHGEEWRISKLAGRLDWQISSRDDLTFLMDYYDGGSDMTVLSNMATPPYRLRVPIVVDDRGYNTLGRWQHRYSPTSELILQSYFSHSDKELVSYVEDVNTFDLDMQHRFGLGRRQEILWGLGYRVTDGRLKSTAMMVFDPEQRTDQLFSAFLQDDIALLPRKLSLIVGSKFEKNDYSGWETQPNARLLWKPVRHHTLWTAVSRAVRTPTRYESDARTNLGGTFSIFGNRNMASEELTAYEAGYRFYPSDRYLLDLALFYNQYDKLKTLKAAPLGSSSIVNGMSGTTCGAELLLGWQALDWWHLQSAYTYLQMDLGDPYSADAIAHAVEGQNPENQFSLRSAMDFGRHWELDLWLRYVDDLPAVTQQIAGYWNMDARLGWRRNQWSIDLVGKNLFDPSHPEFVSELLGIVASEIERAVYLKVTWRYGS